MFSAREIAGFITFVIVIISLVVLEVWWLCRRNNNAFDKIDAIRSKLRQAGWRVEVDDFHSFLLVRVGVTARRGEHIIRVESWSELGALEKAYQRASALGLIGQERETCASGAITVRRDDITLPGGQPAEPRP